MWNTRGVVREEELYFIESFYNKFSKLQMLRGWRFVQLAAEYWPEVGGISVLRQTTRCCADAVRRSIHPPRTTPPRRQRTSPVTWYKQRQRHTQTLTKHIVKSFITRPRPPSLPLYTTGIIRVTESDYKETFPFSTNKEQLWIRFWREMEWAVSQCLIIFIHVCTTFIWKCIYLLIISVTREIN